MVALTVGILVLVFLPIALMEVFGHRYTDKEQ